MEEDGERKSASTRNKWINKRLQFDSIEFIEANRNSALKLKEGETEAEAEAAE